MKSQLSKYAKEVLLEQGWFLFRDAKLASNILDTAYLFGIPVCQPGVPLVVLLTPQTTEKARPNSTSALFGLRAFPLHTDMAHWPIPPRYLVMRAKNVASGVPTLLIDSQKLDLDIHSLSLWRRSLWKVSKIQNSYLCSIFFGSRGKTGLRWDACTMSPYGELSSSLASKIERKFQDILDKFPIIIDWKTPDDILVIDNWRMLHARPPIPNVARHRALERVLIREADFD